MGGSYVIAVNIPTAWSVQGNLGWATATPTDGSGPGSVTVTVAPNPNNWERDMSFPIGGVYHTLNQEAATDGAE